jgi:hypothetical protein
VGATQNTTILDCYATCDVLVAAVEAGGLVGLNHGTISDSYATGNVTGGAEVGGLVGINLEDCTVSNCYATGNVEGVENVGGLVGSDCEGTISHCYVTGTVSGHYRTGGLLGRSDFSTVSDCYATGPVDGNHSTGGLVGLSLARAISNCYAAGAVDGNDYTGALVGVSGRVPIPTTFVKCFWDSDVNPDVNGFGNPDMNGFGNGTDPNVVGKSTAEMMQEATFDNWDFVEIWNIGENQTYPFLRVYSAGDLDHNDKVNFGDVAILCSHWLEEN